MENQIQTSSSNQIAIQRLVLIVSIAVIVLVIGSAMFVVYSSQSQSKESIFGLMAIAYTTSLFIYLSTVRPLANPDSTQRRFSLLATALITLTIEFVAVFLALLIEYFFIIELAGN